MRRGVITLPDMKDHRKLVVEGEWGHYFNCLPTEKDRKDIDRNRNIVVLMSILLSVAVVMLLILAISAPVDEWIYMFQLFLFTYLILLMIVLGVMVKIGYDERRDVKKKRRGQEIDTVKLIAYIKVFPSVMFIYENYFYTDERTNVLMMDQIKEVHLDASDFLRSKGVRVPLSFGFFRQKSPSHLMYDASLYTIMSPMDHLVRVQFKRPIRVKVWNPDIKRFSLVFPTHTVRSVDNIIVSIRPKDQARFKELVDRYASAAG